MLRELEFKKPQLDELVSTAESLKSDANKLQLQNKGEFHVPKYFLKFFKRTVGCLSAWVHFRVGGDGTHIYREEKKTFSVAF